MNSYMVDIALPEVFTPDFVKLIPAQRAHVNALLGERIIDTYTLALDRSKLWATVSAANEEEVMDVLAEMPLMKYMKVNIYELAFHESSQVFMPELSLN